MTTDRHDEQDGAAHSDQAKQAKTPHVEDPFRLLGDLLEASGMTDRQTAAFAIAAQLPAAWRTIRAIRDRLILEWGPRAPDRRTLEGWSSTFGWETLFARHESAVARLHLEMQDLQRRQHSDDVAKQAAELRNRAADQVRRMLDSYNEPVGDVSTWPVNARTRQPVPPKRTLAGIQGLAYLWRAAVDGERLALDMPTSISDNKLQASVRQEVDVSMSLADWREHSKREREAAEQAEALAAGAGAPLGLPSPADPTTRLGTKRDFSRLTEEQKLDFPDTWFHEDRDDETLIDADPDDPMVRATALEASDDDPDEEAWTEESEESPTCPWCGKPAIPHPTRKGTLARHTATRDLCHDDCLVIAGAYQTGEYERLMDR